MSVSASKYGQSKTLIGLAFQEYTLHLHDFIGSGTQPLVDDEHQVRWDYGTGHIDITNITESIYRWPSPGVFDMSITFYEVVTVSPDKDRQARTNGAGHTKRGCHRLGQGGRSISRGDRLPVHARDRPKGPRAQRGNTFGFLLDPDRRGRAH